MSAAPRTLTIRTDLLLAALDAYEPSALLDGREVGRLYVVARELVEAAGGLPCPDGAEAFDGLGASGYSHAECEAIGSIVREMQRSG